MKNLIISALIIAPFAACSVPAAPPGQQEAAKLDPPSEESTRTVKPGADVQIRSELRETLSPGDAGALNVTFTEGYTNGDMQITATTSNGLELLTTADATSFNMATGDTHEWTVYFDAPVAGKHYVNFHVRVDTAIGPLTRSSAAIVQVGKASDTSTASKSAAPVETDAGGKPVIVMQAEETIVQN